MLVAHNAWAQQPSEAMLQAYKRAKAHYIAAEYDTAKELLIPLIEDLEQPTVLTPYALFYYALATYHSGEPPLAESTFSTLVEEFPSWSQVDEAHYWLAHLRFEAQDYLAALARIQVIESSAVQKAALKLKRYFLSIVTETATLQSLLHRHPQDKDIAQVLFDKIVHQPLPRQDIALLDKLTSQFGFQYTRRDPLKHLRTTHKAQYKVAVLLPFFLDEIDYKDEKSAHPFIVSLYKGLKVAVAQLAQQGIHIQLLAYDTKKDPIATAALLESPALSDVDLIIGPLYAATIPLVTAFAQARQINLFNPLSENADVVGHNPFTFLFKPSEETQAREAAEFTASNADSEINVGIVYGTAQADSNRAHAYKQHIERLTGQEVGLMLRIDVQGAQGFLDKIRKILNPPPKSTEEKEEEDTEPEANPLEGLTHIYVASKDALIAANFLSAVEMCKLKVCVIGHEAWLRQSTSSFDQLRRCKLHMVAPNYIDYSQPAIYDFRKAYYTYYKQYPDDYACTGYEMMLLLGNMLAQHGTYFQKHWRSHGYYPGTLFSGAMYGQHHDNQHVPIIKFKGAQLVICNASRPPEVPSGERSTIQQLPTP